MLFLNLKKRIAQKNLNMSNNLEWQCMIIVCQASLISVILKVWYFKKQKVLYSYSAIS